MLSYINQQASKFEETHGIQPNLLYLGEEHVQHLMNDFSDQYDLNAIMDFLQMEIVISNEIVHPHVGWTRFAQKHAV